MKKSIVFPFQLEEDNRNAFAFTLELARRSNSDVLVLAPFNDASEERSTGMEVKGQFCRWKSEFYCRLLELMGHYHGRYNQWRASENTRVQVLFADGNFTRALSDNIRDDQNSMLVLQHKLFSGIGLAEELSSDHPCRQLTIFILPDHRNFNEPSSDLSGVSFEKQKRTNFNRILSETKLFTLPKDRFLFRQDLIIQQAG